MTTLPNICDRCEEEGIGESAFALPKGWAFWKGHTLCKACLPSARAIEFLQEEVIRKFMEELQ